jgi:hypothetical protein
MSNAMGRVGDARAVVQVINKIHVSGGWANGDFETSLQKSLQ